MSYLVVEDVMNQSACLGQLSVPRGGLPVDLPTSLLSGGGLSDSLLHSCFSRE